MGDDDVATIRRLQRALLALGTLSIALLVALLVFAVRDDPAGSVARRVAATTGVMDSHPDADVGRVLLPGLSDRDFQGAPLATNAWGMRERPYALAKPPGVVRVVLLGDSYVFGWGVPAEERVGVRLEELLVANAGVDDPAVEVLHLAVPSWSVLSECAYLRRQLDVLRPDLVVQVLVGNDLDDVAAVRGFGEMATFGARFRDRADALVYLGHPPWALGSNRQSLLSAGLDWLSRARYAEASAALVDLADAVARTGGRYLALVHFGLRTPIAGERLVADLGPERTAWLPAEFSEAREHRVTDGDGHWSPLAHRRVAELLQALIVQRDLLPSLDLAPTATSDAALELHERGEQQSRRRVAYERMLGPQSIARSLTFPDPGDDGAGQVHGGIDAEGRVGRYGAVALAAGGVSELVVSGRTLDRQTLIGTTLTVRVDGRPLEELVFDAPDAPIELRIALPADQAEAPYLTVEFLADDHAYAADDPRHAVAWRLSRVAVVE